LACHAAVNALAIGIALGVGPLWREELTERCAMAIDRTYPRLFSACRSGVIAISDYLAGKVVATVPIDYRAGGSGGRGPPAAPHGVRPAF
jgi:hypothetical protein